MTNSPVVTVILPNFNHAAFVDRALESVMAQTWPHLDVVVVDDGSTDNSMQVLKAWEPRGVRVVRQKNQGVSAARNLGIEIALGDYIAFLDADDLWPRRDMLETAVRLLEEESDLGWTFGDARPFRTLGTQDIFLDAPYLQSGGYYSQSHQLAERRPVTPLDLCNNDRFFIPTGTLVIRRQCFHEVGNFDVGLNMFEDTDMWLRLLRYPVAFFPSVLLNRRVHESNISHRRWAHLGDLQTLFARHNLEKYGVSFDFHAARAHNGTGRDAWQRKAYAAASSAFAQSLRHHWNWKTFLWYVRAKTAQQFHAQSSP